MKGKHRNEWNLTVREIVTRTTALLNSKAVTTQDTAGLRGLKHDLLCRLFVELLGAYRPYLGADMTVYTNQSLRDSGVDVLACFERERARIGLQIKSDYDCSQGDLSANVKRQITESRKYDLDAYYVIFCADLTGASVRERVRALQGELLQLQDPVLRPIQPETAGGLILKREELPSSEVLITELNEEGVDRPALRDWLRARDTPVDCRYFILRADHMLGLVLLGRFQQVFGILGKGALIRNHVLGELEEMYEQGFLGRESLSGSPRYRLTSQHGARYRSVDEYERNVAPDEVRRVTTETRWGSHEEILRTVTPVETARRGLLDFDPVARELARRGFDGDLFKIRLWRDECGQVGDLAWQETVETAELFVVFMEVRNVSEEPLLNFEIEGREVQSGYVLRNYSSAVPEGEAVQVQVPRVYIEPRESLLVPLAYGFGFHTWAGRTVHNERARTGAIEGRIGDEPTGGRVFGTQFSPTRVKVVSLTNQTVDLRPREFEPARTLKLTWYLEMGCCPFVTCRIGSDWVVLGTVLDQGNGREVEARIELPAGTHTVRLVEAEHERAIFTRIEVRSPQGKLIAASEGPIHLTHGESHQVEIGEVLEPGCHLVCRGRYETDGEISPRSPYRVSKPRVLSAHSM